MTMQGPGDSHEPASEPNAAGVTSPRARQSRGTARAGLAAVALGVGVLVVACQPAAAPAQGDHDPAWFAGAARACALQASCAHGHQSSDTRDPGRCLAAWVSQLEATGPSARQECMMHAKTCEAAHACEAPADHAAAAFCAAHPGTATGCDGNVRVACGDDADEAERVDCAAVQGTCEVVKHAGGLTESACMSRALCPAGAKEGRCEGAGVVLTCQDGAAERIACKRGQRCVARRDDDGVERAACEAEGSPRCSAPGARYCEGERLVACMGPRGNEKGSVEVTDCAAAGLRCEGQGKTAGCYVRGKPDCSIDDAPVCNDGTMLFCALGRRAEVPCGALGAAKCEGGALPVCHLPH